MNSARAVVVTVVVVVVGSSIFLSPVGLQAKLDMKHGLAVLSMRHCWSAVATAGVRNLCRDHQTGVGVVLQDMVD